MTHPVLTLLRSSFDAHTAITPPEQHRWQLLLTTHAQRFYEGPVGFSFPMLFSGVAALRESFDDEAEVFRVHLEVSNRTFGFLFGYEGAFTCEFVPATDAPAGLKPVRHERRT